MTLAEIKECLEKAVVLRVPMFDPNDRSREKIERLESHLLECAWHRGELEEAYYWAIEAGKILKRQWDGEATAGYEANLRSARSRITKEDVDRAKAVLRPDIWESLEECRGLVSMLQRQISRLGGTDYDAVSRAYTLISGG